MIKTPEDFAKEVFNLGIMYQLGCFNHENFNYKAMDTLDNWHTDYEKVN